MSETTRSAQVFQGFVTAAAKHPDVVLEKAQYKAAPARRGFASRFVNWLSGGESARKINVNTRHAFMASIHSAFGKEGAQRCVEELNFMVADTKPLSSREILDVAKLLASDKSVSVKNAHQQGVSTNFECKDGLLRSNCEAFAKNHSQNDNQSEESRRK